MDFSGPILECYAAHWLTEKIEIKKGMRGRFIVSKILWTKIIIENVQQQKIMDARQFATHRLCTFFITAIGSVFRGIRRLRHHKIPFELCHFFMNSLLKWTWWLRVTSGLIPIWKISFGFFSKFSLDFSTLKFRLGFLGSPVYIEYHSVCDMLECNFIYEFPNIFHWIYMIHAMANASHVGEGGDFFSFYYTQPMAATIPREREKEKNWLYFPQCMQCWYCEHVKMNWKHFSCDFYCWIYLIFFLSFIVVLNSLHIQTAI